MMNWKEKIRIADQRIRPFIKNTPLDLSTTLTQQNGCQVYLKLENLQHTNAFKIRGAINKLLSLTPSQREKGIVTASSGNHGTAVACGLQKLNLVGQVFVPEHASPVKIQAIKNYGVSVIFHGHDCLETENFAQEYAEKNGMVYIPPYNDPDIIAGQGTIALEIASQMDKMDAVFVPIGGGGLISGIAAYVKTVSPKTKVIGCLPKNSPVMAESIKAGHIIEMESFPTLSDATAGGIEAGAMTFDLCQQFVDDYILVTEEEIKEAIKLFLFSHKMLIEGAAGVTIAAIQKSASKFSGQNLIGVLSGGNISLDDLKSVLA